MKDGIFNLEKIEKRNKLVKAYWKVIVAAEKASTTEEKDTLMQKASELHEIIEKLCPSEELLATVRGEVANRSIP